MSYSGHEASWRFEDSFGLDADFAENVHKRSLKHEAVERHVSQHKIVIETWIAPASGGPTTRGAKKTHRIDCEML